MSEALRIIQDPTLTYKQELLALARLGESTDDSLRYSDEYYEAKKKGALCDLNEGVMPYRPRYICPDYELLFKNGCKFLALEPPKDLLEAVNALEIFYCHVPSITSFPVYLGDLDKLLEPFVVKEDRAFAKKVLGLFLRNIDRVQTDSFVHADIGPEDSVTARLLLELTEEMQLAVPNLTLRYDPEKTSDDFALACVKCMLRTAKPSFANHRMFVKEWGERYAIASCYNGLSIGGGGYTLPRLRLYECSLGAKDVDDFLTRELPRHIDLQLEYMDKRVKFIVEQSSFFKTNFLVTEGFVKQENFTGMFGVVGLAECCNRPRPWASASWTPSTRVLPPTRPPTARHTATATASTPRSASTPTAWTIPPAPASPSAWSPPCSSSLRSTRSSTPISRPARATSSSLRRPGSRPPRRCWRSSRARCKTACATSPAIWRITTWCASRATSSRRARSKSSARKSSPSTT